MQLAERLSNLAQKRSKAQGRALERSAVNQSANQAVDKSAQPVLQVAPRLVAERPPREIPGTPQFDPVVEVIESAIKDGAIPGAVVLVAQSGRVEFFRAFGNRSPRVAKAPEPGAMQVETVFDVASLTSAAVTTTLVMKLVEAGMFSPDERVCRYEQSFGILGKSPITIAQLLSHTSGLPVWLPFFEELLRENAGSRRGVITSRGARDYIYNAINRLQVKPNTSSGRPAFSDVGVILLGHLIEMLTGAGLEKAATRLIFHPLLMKSTSFVDLSMIKRRGIHPVTDLIAPTEDCPWRERSLCGEVHDDNAWVMGGIAGHSGLFTTAWDLHRLSFELLACFHGKSDFVARELVTHFWRGPGEYSEGWRYGWDSPSAENQLGGLGFSPQTVGQNSFTGCSLWIDPQRELEIIVMSNRICPSRNNKKFLQIRPELHRRILRAVDGGTEGGAEGSSGR